MREREKEDLERLDYKTETLKDINKYNIAEIKQRLTILHFCT